MHARPYVGIETNVWKLIVGKTAPEEAYSTDQLRQDYTKALPKIDPEALMNNHAKIEDMEAKMEALTQENQRQ